MSITDAWKQIFSLSSGNKWNRIPDDLKKIVGLDSRVGIFGGMLCTQNAANGTIQFLNRLNAIGEK
jgi:hypothetical protein